MIIKTLSWKKLMPARLASYINDSDKVKNTQPIYWNVSHCSTDALIQDFKNNDQYLSLRSNSNRMLHEVISFSPLDSEYLNEDIVRQLTFEYLRIRGEKQIAYGEIHRDNNWHVHLMLTPNGVGDRKVVQIKKPEYLKIRYEMEVYQKTFFPELKHSLVFLDKNRAKTKTNEKQFQLEKRTQKSSRVSEISHIVKQCFNRSSSMDEFLDMLVQNGYTPYKYRNKVNGLKFENTKYRFSRLGIDTTMIQALQKQENTLIQKRLQELDRLDHQSSKSQDLCR